MKLSITWGALVFLLVGSGCGRVDDACGLLADRAAACFGPVASLDLGSCSPPQAEALLPLDCDGLYESLASGKADGALGAELREIIRKEVSRAVGEALTQAVAALPQSLLSWLGQIDESMDYYASLGEAPTAAEAAARAGELAVALSAAGFSPVVHQLEPGRYAVLHDRCPADRLHLLVEQLAGLLVDSPRIVKAIGGELDYHYDDGACGASGQSVPPSQLSRLPHFGFSAAPGCSGCDLFASSCVGAVGQAGYGLTCVDQRASDFSCTHGAGNNFRQCSFGGATGDGRCDGWQFCLPSGQYAPCQAIPAEPQLYFDAALGQQGAMQCLTSGEVRPARGAADARCLTIRARLPLTIIPVHADGGLAAALGCVR